MKDQNPEFSRFYFESIGFITKELKLSFEYFTSESFVTL